MKQALDGAPRGILDRRGRVEREIIDFEISSTYIFQLDSPVLPMKLESAAPGDGEPGASAIAGSHELEGYDLRRPYLLGHEGELQTVFDAEIAAAHHLHGIFSVG